MKRVSYGEVVERDRTVCVSCFFDGNGLTSCGWCFKPILSEDPFHIDVAYFPSDRVVSTLQTLPLQKSVFDHCSTVLFGSHLELEEKDAKDTITNMKELKQTIRVDCRTF